MPLCPRNEKNQGRGPNKLIREREAEKYINFKVYYSIIHYPGVKEVLRVFLPKNITLDMNVKI